MGWCPNCKLEYVEGIKICPDCKTALVDKLEEDKSDSVITLKKGLIELSQSDDLVDSDDFDEFDDIEEDDNEELEVEPKSQMAELVKALEARGIPREEIDSIIENARRSTANAYQKYKPVSERYTENKSAAGVLTVCGILGILVLVLNEIGIFTLPVHGFSKYLTDIVMGGLFLIFVFFGIKAAKTVKKLQPELEAEEAKTKELVDFLKDLKKKGVFDVNGEMVYEEKTLMLSNFAIAECEKQFDDLAPGFSYYVTDRYYSEIFEDEDDLTESDED